MKNFCKKECFWGILCILCASFFASCSDVVDADGGSVLSPDSSRPIAHKLYPNDIAKNDSAAVNLARGIALVVHPGASYTLSFDIDSTQPAPELQLFRTYDLAYSKDLVGSSRIRTLSPTVVGNRYVYSFTCEENKMSIWLTSLGVDGEYYKGKVNNIRFQGFGSYSDHLSINLIVVGSMVNTLDGKNIDELASYMLKLFREKYYGITIDTLYVRYAHNHPTLGPYYPGDQPWVAGISSEDMFVSELAGWPEDGLRNALNIVLVHSIKNKDVMGYSHIFSGILGAGKQSSVVIGEYVKRGNGYELLSSYNIIITALHETGHFFGLRHTSSTKRDLGLLDDVEDDDGVIEDLSNVEDGLKDTPFCDVFSSPRNTLYKSSEGADDYALELDLHSCPDKYNIMFPVTLDKVGVTSFSEQQMEIVRSSLMIFPH